MKSFSLGSVAKITSGGTPSRQNSDYWNGSVPWVKTGEINQRFIYDSSETITPLGVSKSAAKVYPANTLLMAMYGQGKTRGKVAILKIEAAINQACAAIVPDYNILDTEFLFHELEHRYQHIRNLSNVGNQENLNAEIIRSIKIPDIPLPEQKKIAEILGACDEAIEAQERLIAQKQQRKKGLMQKLLTGQTRFPKFAGTPWRQVRLGVIGSVTGAGVDKKSNVEEVPVRLVNYMDVYRNSFITSEILDHEVTAPEKKAKQCSTKIGDVFFTPTSEKPTDIANSAVALEDIPDAVYSYHVVRLRLAEDWDLRFRAYAFTTDEFMRQAERICEGSGTRYVISLEDFRGITVRVPSKEEQSAISTVLSACDEEITLQQSKLEQLKQQKKGLMQQLLTGKVRVKV